MAAAHPLPTTAGEAQPATANPSATTAEHNSKQALVPAPAHEESEDLGPTVSSAVARLPVEVDVAVPVSAFRVRHLLALEPGQVIESQWSSGDDTPLAAGNVQLAWTEFEVVDTQMAVRVTRLA
jgi:flagellar motor switch/type III secretory pathway protein FliN